MSDTPGTLGGDLVLARLGDYPGAAGVKRMADEIASLRARVAVLEGALERLIVAVEFEVPPIRDGVGIDHRLDVLALSAREAREALNTPPSTGEEG